MATPESRISENSWCPLVVVVVFFMIVMQLIPLTEVDPIDVIFLYTHIISIPQIDAFHMSSAKFKRKTAIDAEW